MANSESSVGAYPLTSHFLFAADVAPTIIVVTDCRSPVRGELLLPKKSTHYASHITLNSQPSTLNPSQPATLNSQLTTRNSLMAPAHSSRDSSNSRGSNRSLAFVMPC